MKRWTNGLPGATMRLGAMMAQRGLSASQPRMRADTRCDCASLNPCRNTAPPCPRSQNRRLRPAQTKKPCKFNNVDRTPLPPVQLNSLINFAVHSQAQTPFHTNYRAWRKKQIHLSTGLRAAGCRSSPAVAMCEEERISRALWKRPIRRPFRLRVNTIGSIKSRKMKKALSCRFQNAVPLTPACPPRRTHTKSNGVIPPTPVLNWPSRSFCNRNWLC
jgi:hypothetical protein